MHSSDHPALRFTQDAGPTLGSLPGQVPKPWDPLADGDDDTGEDHASEQNPEI